MCCRLLIGCFSLLVISCTKHEKTAAPEIATNTNPAESQLAISDTVKPDSLYYPSELDFAAKLITTGNFHSDEIWERVTDEKWMGLFKSRSGYYIKDTKISAKKVHDAIADLDEADMTGWEINVTDKDSLLVLVSGLELPRQKVTDIRLDKYVVMPGEMVKFKYKAVEYTLSATGDKITLERDEVIIKNYRLYLSSTKNDVLVRQLLAAWPHIDDQMITILFVGDIDNDGTPDFLIDTSGHYNATIPTLYLSKSAGTNAIVKPVASHTRTGC